MITNERKLELRKAVADAAGEAIRRIPAATATSLALRGISSEEDAYMQRYLTKLAEKVAHGLFVDEAEL